MNSLKSNTFILIRKLSLFLLALVVSSTVFAQQPPTDSIKNLDLVIVKGYQLPQLLLRANGAIGLIDSNQIKNQPSNSLVSVLNTIPGIRMEERSPGSYRLSARGSLLRSPFGIRNIKIYMDDFPLTDAGGNTYLNLIDPIAIHSMEIYKGPEASIFGANTGGAVLINSGLNETNKLGVMLTAGSYGLFQQAVNLQRNFKKYNFSVIQGYQRSDGYRENTALERKYIQTAHQFKYSTKGALKAFAFYSNLAYETPGALTANQWAANPRSARPSTPTQASAVDQQAAIYNKTLYGALAHEYQLGQHFKHSLSVFASTTDFENPFIFNYEKRKESNIGLRTALVYEWSTAQLKSNLLLGLETAQNNAHLKNYGNSGGSPTQLQAEDKLVANQSFAFLRANFDISSQLLLELGLSFNLFKYRYQSLFPLAEASKSKNFKNQLMPKIAASYRISPNLTWRAALAKGYSPPTIAEVRSSDNMINTNLQPEQGWNSETGIRFQTNNKRFYADGNFFYFRLKDAIVRRLNSNDIEYFINAGGTKQFGIELQLQWQIFKQANAPLLTSVSLSNSSTYSRFSFSNFKNATVDYTGNRLTGVPSFTAVNGVTLQFRKGFFLFGQYNFTSAIPLNDANTVFAKRYHLADLKLGIPAIQVVKHELHLSLGINNLFNQRYSLGNDLNAANNRYYNPAPGLNFYSSLKMEF